MADKAGSSAESRSRNLTPTYETDEDDQVNLSVLSRAGITTRGSSRESGLTAVAASNGAMVVFRVRFPTQSTSVVETTTQVRLDEALKSLMKRFGMVPATLRARRVGQRGRVRDGFSVH